MTEPGGWRPLADQKRGAEAFVTTPFARLARAHSIAVTGDTLIAIALAGSLFFSIDPEAARGKVFLYLALTMAPFAVVAPLVGPALDRTPGGRRWMVIGSSAARAFVCVLMVRHVDTLFLFPEAFALLVLSKSYHVAKSALVPTTVRSDVELVQANSKLSLISGVVGFAAAVPGGILLRFGGSEWVLGFAVLVFLAGVVVGFRLDKTQVATGPATEEERDELRGAGVLLAASAMGLLRGVVGFLTFLLAFTLRTGDSPTWHFGVVLALSAAGSLAGAALAPHLRRVTTEERMLTGLLVTVAAFGVLSAWAGGLAGAALIALAVGVAASGAKLAFDAIVQRDAPDANRGRSFARFETRFQLSWVVGAVLGIVPMPRWIGFLIVAGVALFAGISYQAAVRGARSTVARRMAREAERSIDVDGPTRELPPTIVSPFRRRRTRPQDETDEIAPYPDAIALPGQGPDRRLVDPDREPEPPIDPTRLAPPSRAEADPTLVDEADGSPEAAADWSGSGLVDPTALLPDDNR